jgi:hypothetical protein
MRTIGLDDILIIAPYNAQVFELKERIPGGRIGTVDKFQGQEAPIVIYSITTSSHADAPRGMEFLYSANRLNVATASGGRPSCRPNHSRVTARRSGILFWNCWPSVAHCTKRAISITFGRAA